MNIGNFMKVFQNLLISNNYYFLGVNYGMKTLYNADKLNTA